MEAADLYRDRLDESERAVEVYQQVLEIDPDDPELVIPAAFAIAVVRERFLDIDVIVDGEFFEDVAVSVHGFFETGQITMCGEEDDCISGTLRRQ